MTITEHGRTADPLTLLGDAPEPGRGRSGGLRFERPPSDDAYHDVEWQSRQALVGAFENPVFVQDDVEFPAAWSDTAVSIVAHKYFRGALGEPGRERSLRELIERVAGTIESWGAADGYFRSPEDAKAFGYRLRRLMVCQEASFNSPVWFNIGVKGVAQQASACFILSVDDSMEDVLAWYVEEGRIFKGGSGAGVNLSRLRAEGEPLAGGGASSGPTSFMRAADASAGTIRSGGKTRRAAKMVLLDVDHPDIETFIACKAREEKKARWLAQGGFDVDFDGVDAASLAYQNANHSVRLSDEFMAAAKVGGRWKLEGRTSDVVNREVDAATLLRRIAECAWDCGDPGVQFSTTISAWHTTPSAGPIRGSNPCSEYMSLDDTACNLASLNVTRFVDAGGRIDVARVADAVRVMIVAQDILVGRADYPTATIGERTVRYRQLGLGLTNVGGALMRAAIPYGSAQAQQFAAAWCSLLSGAAYATSAEIAAEIGPFAGYAADAGGVAAVLEKHLHAAQQLAADAAGTQWGEACEEAVELWQSAATAPSGVRNAQATVLAPTGTISFMMDADTTGIEPDVALVATKRLAGGGELRLVNGAVRTALGRLGYDDDAAGAAVAHLEAGGRITDPDAGIAPGHWPVFATAVGEVQVSADEHIAMMAACQPFISGAISKTVNVPGEATVNDIETLLWTAWSSGLKAVAIYRDQSKVSQPLSDANDSQSEPSASLARVREELPRERRSRTISFRVADCHGYMTVGEYDDGRPAELWLSVSKQGSTLAGILNSFAASVSLGLQHGVPLGSYVAHMMNTKFEPSGITDDAELRLASSIVDYLFRRMAIDYLDCGERQVLGVLTVEERTEPTLPGVEEAVAAQQDTGVADSAPLCMTCGTRMRRAGACYSCDGCGETSGCG